MNRLPFGFSQSVWGWLGLAVLGAIILVPVLGFSDRLIASSAQLSAARSDLDRLETALAAQIERNARLASEADITQAEWADAHSPEAGTALIDEALEQLETALLERSARIARVETPVVETLNARTLALTSEVVFVLPVADALDVLASWDAPELRVEALSLVVLAGQEVQVRIRVSYVMLREPQEG